MDRRILIQVTAPAVVLGLILLGTCLVSAWIVNRLQTNLSRILSENVTSLEAAQELETRVRILHLHCFRYLVDPDRASLDREMQEDMRSVDRAFRQSLEDAGGSPPPPRRSRTASGRSRRATTATARNSTISGPALPSPGWTTGAGRRGPDPPRGRAVRARLQVNKHLIEQTRQESTRVSRLLHVALLLLGVVGPASGLILGWGMARA